MIRAIILCCDEKNQRRMSLRDLPGAAATLVQSTQYELSKPRLPSHDPSLEKSYGDGLNCGYMQVRHQMMSS